MKENKKNNYLYLHITNYNRKEIRKFIKKFKKLKNKTGFVILEHENDNKNNKSNILMVLDEFDKIKENNEIINLEKKDFDNKSHIKQIEEDIKNNNKIFLIITDLKFSEIKQKIKEHFSLENYYKLFNNLFLIVEKNL